ncbi:autotransporter outer membrane beta-barrel domain-containing protein [Sphingomonas xanthus]|uniref:autotransporter outer membrane beta-barrel domain-containing protein n=1 Tax=Sphingomonas xanthus TaxID=2594473 RepID=UPI00164D32AB|nr:autotransporter outer membrane beta-barrel domain-containing protein [Sphingomonas xanthus]
MKRRAKLLGAGASLLALGFVNLGQAQAANVAGISQADEESIALDLRGFGATSGAAAGSGQAQRPGQQAVGTQALVELDNSETMEFLASVETAASDFAIGSTVMSGVIQQVATGTASGTGTAKINNSGEILIGISADVAAGSTALALAGIDIGITQSAFGGEGASVTMANSGSIAMVAEAEALAAGGGVTDFASAQAYVFGIHAFASATGTAGNASVDLSNLGTIEIDAVAHATGSGYARAAASAAQGMVGTAMTAGSGPAAVSLTNVGELSLVGQADATGGYTGHATAIAAHGMIALAGGHGDATAEIANSGDLTLLADADVSAGTNAYAVAIAIGAIKATAHGGIGSALSSVTNSADIALIANAEAEALNAQAFAIVGGTFGSGAVYQSAHSYGGDASAIADNSGSISVVANALANGDVVASASAVGGPGFNQFAFATEGDARANFANSGSMEFVAQAEANGANSAFADAIFYNAVGQFANANGGAGQGIADLANTGSISVGVFAESHGVTWGEALAIGNRAVVQGVLTVGNDAIGHLDNDGSIEVNVAALAEGSVAEATAMLQTGIVQELGSIGSGEAYGELTNNGSIDFNLIASANSLDGHGHAEVELEGGIVQYVGAGSSQYVYGTTGGLTQITQDIYPTGPATAQFTNSGSVDITAAAIGHGGTMAIAELTGLAIDQFARGSDAEASFDNEGTVEIQALALAEGAGDARAEASLTGLVQSAAALETTVHITATTNWGQVTDSVVTPVGTGTVSLTNSGSFEIAGLASAEGGSGDASAAMRVQGVAQSVAALNARAEFTNDGEFIVTAKAEAVAGGAANATAEATGYAASGPFDHAVDVLNNGDFTVVADALADGGTGTAFARAVGIAAAGTGLLSGDIANSVDLLVRANAAGGSALAEATGIQVGVNADGLNIVNSGVLAVFAATDGGDGKATGIGVVDTGQGGPGTVTVTNDGGLITARVSADSGATWSRGTAIDLSAGSSASVINLVGDGGISGNINLAAGQTINVTGGETWFDGIINAECALAVCGEGRLNIGNGGTLFLRHASAIDGPSGAYLEQLDITAGGTIVFELPTGADPESAYPQIFADVANLDGTLLVRSQAGLYDDSYLFENVIDADVRNGQFDHCGIDGDPALLSLSCVYDSQGNVDLKLDRVAFDAVAGLTRNQRAVGSGIEAVYDLDLEGDFGEMVGQLFTFDEDGYRRAVDQLTGSSHAAYMQSFNAIGVQQNDLIDRAVGCELPMSELSSLACRTSKVSMWGQIDFANRRSDGDAEAGAYDSDRWMAAVGADAQVGEDMVAGISLTKVTNRLDFHDGGRWKADGYQLGAYGVIDRGQFYAKAMTSYGWFNGHSRRFVDWSSSGGSLAGMLTGEPDARLWTLGARFGYRVPLGGASQLTPFINIDHSSATLKGFTEAGLPVAALRVEKSTSSRTAVTVGTKWAGDVGGAVPQLELGYRRLFGDRRATFDAAFADAPGSDFSIVSALEKRGALLAGASLGGKVGLVDVRVGYQGLFDAVNNSHSANFRLTLPLGGK